MSRTSAAHDDEVFTADPTPWIEGTVLDHDLQHEEDLGIFHVTTRISAVERDGALKARKDLGATRGLGGGPQNIASGYISFVYSLGRSRWLYDAMKSAREAVEESGLATALAVLDWTSFPDGFDIEGNLDMEEEADVRELDEQMLALLGIFGIEEASGFELEQLGSAAGWIKVLKTHADEINEALPLPFQRYKAMQAFENQVDEWYVEPMANAYNDYEGVVCANIVGFTAHWHQFREIDPAELSIVQVAVRPDAPVDLEPRECELRFFPKDVLIIQTRVEIVGPRPVEGM